MLQRNINPFHGQQKLVCLLGVSVCRMGWYITKYYTEIPDKNDFLPPGQEVSGYIDYSHRLATEDFRPIFNMEKRFLPQKTDLSFFNWDTMNVGSKSSPNYEVILDIGSKSSPKYEVILVSKTILCYFLWSVCEWSDWLNRLWCNHE